MNPLKRDHDYLSGFADESASRPSKRLRTRALKLQEEARKLEIQSIIMDNDSLVFHPSAAGYKSIFGTYSGQSEGLRGDDIVDQNGSQSMDARDGVSDPSRQTGASFSNIFQPTIIPGPSLCRHDPVPSEDLKGINTFVPISFLARIPTPSNLRPFVMPLQITFPSVSLPLLRPDSSILAGRSPPLFPQGSLGTAHPEMSHYSPPTPSSSLNDGIFPSPSESGRLGSQYASAWPCNVMGMEEAYKGQNAPCYQMSPWREGGPSLSPPNPHAHAYRSCDRESDFENYQPYQHDSMLHYALPGSESSSTILSSPECSASFSFPRDSPYFVQGTGSPGITCDPFSFPVGEPFSGQMKCEDGLSEALTCPSCGAITSLLGKSSQSFLPFGNGGADGTEDLGCLRCRNLITSGAGFTNSQKAPPLSMASVSPKPNQHQRTQSPIPFYQPFKVAPNKDYDILHDAGDSSDSVEAQNGDFASWLASLTLGQDYSQNFSLDGGPGHSAAILSNTHDLFQEGIDRPGYAAKARSQLVGPGVPGNEGTPLLCRSVSESVRFQSH